MDTQERVGLVALCLGLIALGLEIYDVWPVLAMHLSALNWIVLALIHMAVLLGLGSLLINERKNAQSRALVFVVTITVIMSWAFSFSLMGKIGH